MLIVVCDVCVCVCVCCCCYFIFAFKSFLFHCFPLFSRTEHQSMNSIRFSSVRMCVLWFFFGSFFSFIIPLVWLIQIPCGACVLFLLYRLYVRLCRAPCNACGKSLVIDLSFWLFRKNIANLYFKLNSHYYPKDYLPFLPHFFMISKSSCTKLLADFFLIISSCIFNVL